MGASIGFWNELNSPLLPELVREKILDFSFLILSNYSHVNKNFVLQFIFVVMRTCCETDSRHYFFFFFLWKDCSENSDFKTANVYVLFKRIWRQCFLSLKKYGRIQKKRKKGKKIISQLLPPIFGGFVDIRAM